jgi:hypothetical protein
MFLLGLNEITTVEDIRFDPRVFFNILRGLNREIKDEKLIDVTSKYILVITTFNVLFRLRLVLFSVNIEKFFEK